MTPTPRIAGTYGDKYTTRNPLVRRLVEGFMREVVDLARRTAARRVLEVGAGEGEVSRRLGEALRPEWFVASDVAASCAARLGKTAPGMRCALLSAEALPFRDESFDMVVACEVLEHLDDPAAALRELRRVSRDWILASVPREPLWRALNLARLRYVADLGNTPGHVQHWTRSGFIDFARGAGRVEAVRGPLPWTVVLLRRS
jgi:2-polyprenyl-3-methyl-5-hydroxy-6-metoxy-1,4-benzoquinol methylase